MHIEWSLGSGFFDWAPETQVTHSVAGLGWYHLSNKDAISVCVVLCSWLSWVHLIGSSDSVMTLESL